METIGILGATGPLGRGLALRLAVAGHTIHVGSRARERAQETVEGLLERLGTEVDVRPAVNPEAVEAADIVVVAVPYEGQADTLRQLSPAPGTLVVNVVNPVEVDDLGMKAIDVPAGSAAEECQQLWPDTRVVAAFKEMPARRLLDVESPVDCDVLVAGDDDEAVDRTLQLASELPGARGIRCGPLRNARYLEGLTPLLVAVNKRYKAHSAIRLVGL